MLDTTKRAADYEVLGPWPEADPVPARGISKRLASLEGKTIGLFANGKRAAVPMLEALERGLKAKYPSLKTSWYKCSVFNTPEILTHGKEKFEAWVRGVDAVALTVGD
ncbi:MAG: hypothetical protein A3H35_11800 [Betaproteobacteria bacterium RIFCSPLOWO2_02_FULL_62_17]|nr:MAG: hypothetical protein A3H35_11800 [Betaproteobacteria bacterium RIFCSPLOWO2_02_FULL_62_17]